MKRALALTGLAVLVPVCQGGLSAHLPAGASPDLGLLLVLSLGLVWRSVGGGLLISAASGFAADLLSGALLGQHALLRVLAFGAARGGRVHVNLRGARAQMVFAAVLSVFHAGAMSALTAFFLPGVEVGLQWGPLLLHAAVNAVAAPIVVAGVTALVARLGDEDAGRRLLRIEPRNWAA